MIIIKKEAHRNVITIIIIMNNNTINNMSENFPFGQTTSDAVQ